MIRVGPFLKNTQKLIWVGFKKEKKKERVEDEKKKKKKKKSTSIHA